MMMFHNALVVILLLASTQAIPSVAVNDNAPGQVKKNQAVQGDLAIVTIHNDTDPQWALRTADGSLTPLDKKTFKPPKKDKDGNEFQPGTQVGLNCDIDGDGVCTPSAGTTVAALGSTTTTSGATTTTTVAATVTPAIYQRLLVMILDYGACNYAPGLNESTIRSIFLGPNGDGKAGVAQKYSQCSYGRFNINTTAFRVITVKQNCSTTVTASCSWWAMSNGADTAAKAALGSTVFSSFTHYAYIVPPALQSVCPWAGLALLPGKQIWLQTSSYGVYRWATIMQETIHNYGLWHSWRNGYEYEDYSTAMGRGDACPNAAETSRMGWATPVTGGDAINQTVLTQTGVFRSFALPASYLTGNGNYFRVVPDWLSTYSNILVAKNLYIDVRVAKAGDASLSTSYAPRVNVHEVNATMDNGYPATYVNADRRIQIINMLTNGTRANLTAYNLVVQSGAWVAGVTDTMRVHLCRFASSPAECGTVAVL